MGYYIKSIHWLDAMTPPMERHLEKLAESVVALLSVEVKDQLPAAEPVYEEPVIKRWPIPTWATVLLALIAVVIIGGVGYWIISQMGSATGSASPTEVTSPPDGGSDWRALSFMFSNPQIWEESGDNRYTAVGQREVDAFAWSTETFEGDLSVSLDLERQESQSDGCVIIYGDGHEHSYGSLIFCVDWDGFSLEKHTIYYDEDENNLAFNFRDNESDKVYSVTVEIIDDLASMYVNGEKVFSSFFDTEEIDRSGRIGLYKKWFVGEITFSNIQIKTPTDGD